MQNTIVELSYAKMSTLKVVIFVIIRANVENSLIRHKKYHKMIHFYSICVTKYKKL